MDKLSYIFVLHQTTTYIQNRRGRHSCLISLFYIKPQHFIEIDGGFVCCLISLFYIKPQLDSLSNYYRQVVLYLCSTSNHNPLTYPHAHFSLSYIFVLHQTTTSATSLTSLDGLSYIFVLHQTTTAARYSKNHIRCLISLFYIKPQHTSKAPCTLSGCLISLFYIKPQQTLIPPMRHQVVLYLCSTSNHNHFCLPKTE